MKKYSNGFLSIDIAFGLVIMSFAFVILYYIQLDISREIARDDINALSKANHKMLHNIQTNNGINRTIITNSNKKYNVKFFEADSMPTTSIQNNIMLHYYTINP